MADGNGPFNYRNAAHSLKAVSSNQRTRASNMRTAPAHIRASTPQPFYARTGERKTGPVDRYGFALPRGAPCRVEHHAARDTMPCGIPCHAARDTMPAGV
jgi:hypothetical protein